MSSLKPDRHDPALGWALRYAGKHVRSRSEVLAYLCRRGIAPQTAARALEAAAALGVVDDRACARLWCAHWARQGFAASAIEEKLNARAIEPLAISQAIKALQKEQSDLARARDFLEHAARGGKKTPKQLAQSLARRGFDEEILERIYPEQSHAEEP